jgi:hypothetical protein
MREPSYATVVGSDSSWPGSKDFARPGCINLSRSSVLIMVRLASDQMRGPRGSQSGLTDTMFVCTILTEGELDDAWLRCPD